MDLHRPENQTDARVPDRQAVGGQCPPLHAGRGQPADLPKPHASDAHSLRKGGYKPIVQISTDGFVAYPEAVDLAFGPYAKFGTIMKDIATRA